MTDLVADIGGTNSRFGLAQAGRVLDGSVWQTPNAAFTTFDAALARYIHGRRAPARACIAAAGVVRENTTELTNHVWQIDASKLPVAEVHLLNDLQALGHALAPLGPPNKRKMVLNIGTGLNAAALHYVGGKAFVPPSEAGQTRLPFLTDITETRALRICAEQYGSNAIEAVLSGDGLVRLHFALTQSKLTAEALTDSWPPETLGLALKLLGHCLGDLALTHLPEGGIWLTGSVGKELAQHVHQPEFMAAFSARGPYSKTIKVNKIIALESEIEPLKGAAAYLQGQAAAS